MEATEKFLAETPNASTHELVNYVTNQQMASALKSQFKLLILVRAAIGSEAFKIDVVKKYIPALNTITKDDKIMMRHLIGALEANYKEKPKNFAAAIKLFYDEDGLSEEAILEWADEGRSEYTLDEVDEDARATIRGEAEPVIVWLQESDDEDSDDESDDDE